MTSSHDPPMRARDHARLTALGMIVVFALVLGSCWVNQGNLAIADRVNPSAEVTIGSQTLDLAYGPDAAQLLDVYVPRGTTRGTIVYFHSGGWTGGSKALVPPVIFQQLDRGWAVVSVDYRLAGTPGVQAPQVLADVDRSIRYVKANATTLQLDTSTVVAAGWSAGGHLALMAALAAGFQVAPDLPAELAAVSPVVDAVVSMAATADPADVGGRQPRRAQLGGDLPRLLDRRPRRPDAVRPVHPAALQPRVPGRHGRHARTGAAARLHRLRRRRPHRADGHPGLPLSSTWTEVAGDRTTYVDVPPTGGHDVPARDEQDRLRLLAHQGRDPDLLSDVRVGPGKVGPRAGTPGGRPRGTVTGRP